MKKIALYVAGVLSTAVLVPEASAIPSFARQTGMACNACHAQHFPVLNSFGRSFKASGYTLMGAQAKVEGEHLSIPDTLNASLLLKLRYFKDNTAGSADTTTTATNKGNGQLQFMDESALFFGGRVSDNVGFIMEGNVVSGGSLLAGFRIPFVYEVGNARLSAIPFTTDAMGPQYGYEQSSGGVLRANRWNENRREISAVQYNADRNNKDYTAVAAGDGGAATGFAFVAQNDFGFINFTKWTPSHIPGGNGQGAGSPAPSEMKSDYIRIAATPTVGNWAIVAGAGKMTGVSGSNVNTAGLATLKPVTTKQTFYDFQAQGEVAGKALSIYAQHAYAPAGTNLVGAAVSGVGTDYVNAYNTELRTRKATTFGADYSIIPNVLSIAAAYRKADNGKAIGRHEDNATTLGLVYDLAQNVALHASYIEYNGNAHNLPGDQKRMHMMMLEASF